MTPVPNIPTVYSMRYLALAFLLAGCYADPTAPVVPAPSTAILFTNGCGEAAIFDLFVDDRTPEMYLFPADGVVEKPVANGAHAVRYIVLDANARIVFGRSDTLTVSGPTPYRMACHQ